MASLKAKMTLELQSPFGWDAIEQEQRNFEWTMMVYRWSRSEVSAWDLKRSHTILSKELADRPIEVQNQVVKVTAEIAPDTRHLSKAQVFLGTMVSSAWDGLCVTSSG